MLCPLTCCGGIQGALRWSLAVAIDSAPISARLLRRFDVVNPGPWQTQLGHTNISTMHTSVISGASRQTLD